MNPAVIIAALAIRTLCDGVPEAEPFLQDWPVLQATRPVTPRHLPVLAWLDVARSSVVPATARLVAVLAERSGRLTWSQTYSEDDLGAGFLDRYGWTEVIGTRGPIPSDSLAVGILMLGPETHYPAHAHEAEELYIPLAGTAAWMRGSEGYIDRPPGTAIHHASWTPHAMRTGAEPLVALYLWRGGDLAATSRIIARA